MIERLLQPRLLDLATRYPVLTLTGPRQSGKTTLSRMAFPHLPYASLETPSQRELAQNDPIAFLGRLGNGAIIDEVQRVPQIFSYLQGLVDEDPRPGRFLLTGSQNLALVGAATQSLAGRTTLTELLPLSLEEIRRFPEAPADLETLLWKGGYPRIYERNLPAQEWLADYTATYVELDVRQYEPADDQCQVGVHGLQSVHRAQVIAQRLALMAEAVLRELEQGGHVRDSQLRSGISWSQPHHRAIHFRLRTERLASYRKQDLRASVGLHQHAQIAEVTRTRPGGDALGHFRLYQEHGSFPGSVQIEHPLQNR